MTNNVRSTWVLFICCCLHRHRESAGKIRLCSASQDGDIYNWSEN